MKIRLDCPECMRLFVFNREDYWQAKLEITHWSNHVQLVHNISSDYVKTILKEMGLSS